MTESGIALVPARLLGDTVKSLSNAPVEFETDQSQATIRCAAYEGTFRLLPAEDFPGLQEPSGDHGDGRGRPRSPRRSGRWRAAPRRDEARPVLTGVLLEVSREGVVMVATDSYRLAVRELVATRRGRGEGDRSRARAVRGRPRGRGRGEGRRSSCSSTRARSSFRIGTLTLTSRLIEGEFPNYRQLLPEATESRLDGLAPAAAGRRAPRRPARPRHHAGAAGVQRARRQALGSSPDLGQAVEAVEARYEGEDLTVAFNPQYLADGLDGRDRGDGPARGRDGLKPGVVHGEGEEFTYLVMPVRLPAVGELEGLGRKASPPCAWPGSSSATSATIAYTRIEPCPTAHRGGRPQR